LLDGAGFTAANDYPGMGITGQQCLANGPRNVTHYQASIVPDLNTVQRDDGFVIPAGPSRGLRPDGRIYSFAAHTSVSADQFPTEQKDEQLHASIVNGRAYFFLDCRIP